MRKRGSPQKATLSTPSPRAPHPPPTTVSCLNEGTNQPGCDSLLIDIGVRIRERYELAGELRERYAAAGRSERSEILNGFCLATLSGVKTLARRKATLRQRCHEPRRVWRHFENRFSRGRRSDRADVQRKLMRLLAQARQTTVVGKAGAGCASARYAAIREYSWIRPPSRKERVTGPPAVTVEDGRGTARPRPRCGRARL